MTLRRRGLYDNDFRSIRVVTVVMPVVIIVGRDRSSSSCADTGTHYRAIFATHLSAHRATQGATDCSANRGIFDEIIRPAGRGESAADREQ